MRRLLSAARPRCGDVARCPGHTAPSRHRAEPGGGREEQGSFSSLIPDQSTPGSRAAWACGQGEILHPPPFLQSRVRVYVQVSSWEAQGHGAPDVPGKVPLPAALPILEWVPRSLVVTKFPFFSPGGSQRRNFPPEQACLAMGKLRPHFAQEFALEGTQVPLPLLPGRGAAAVAGLPLPPGQALARSCQAPRAPKFTLHRIF